MEQILAAGGDVITQEQWKHEMKSAVSYAFGPHHILSTNEPFFFATSSTFRKCISRLTHWACTQIHEPLAVAALMHAAKCSHFIILECCALDVGCCFTRTKQLHQMRQVCLCDTSPSNGVIRRSLFYAMHIECTILVYCYYELGHIAQYIVDLAKRIIQASDDWNGDIERGAAEDLRVSLNQCMLVLYQFIKRPPCAIRK